MLRIFNLPKIHWNCLNKAHESNMLSRKMFSCSHCGRILWGYHGYAYCWPEGLFRSSNYLNFSCTYYNRNLFNMYNDQWFRWTFGGIIVHDFGGGITVGWSLEIWFTLRKFMESINFNFCKDNRYQFAFNGRKEQQQIP